jgi:hypothetical protein
VRLEREDAGLFLSALRLISAGYCRSLIIQERHRPGRPPFRRMAMWRFRERLLGRG